MEGQILNDNHQHFMTDIRMYSWWEQNTYALLFWHLGLGSPYDSIVLACAIACANLVKKKPLQRIELKYANVNHMAN